MEYKVHYIRLKISKIGKDNIKVIINNNFFKHFQSRISNITQIFHRNQVQKDISRLYHNMLESFISYYIGPIRRVCL